MCRKDLLDKAFNEATLGINVNSIDDNNILMRALSNSMRAFSDREHADFTDNEIKATILVELEPMLKLSRELFYPSEIMMF